MSRAKQDETQKKVFTRWANMYLSKKGKAIKDLYTDVGDGKLLCQLLEILTEEKIKYNKKPKIRVHKVENCTKALNFVTSQQYTDHHGNQVNIKLTNISGRDIVDAKTTLILGLMFTIISRLQVSDDGEAATKEGVQRSLQNYDITVNNLHKHWCSGNAFAGLVHRYRPDLLDYSSVAELSQEERIEAAFAAAEKAGIARLLDVEDLMVPMPDEKSVYTQVLQYFVTFASGAQKTDAAEKINNLVTVLEKAAILSAEYEKAAGAFAAWTETATDFISEIQTDGDLESLRANHSKLNHWRSASKIKAFKNLLAARTAISELNNHLRANNRPPYEPASGLDIDSLEFSWEDINSQDTNKKGVISKSIKNQEHTLCKAFADSSEAFMTWAAERTAGLTNLDGDTSDRLTAAKAQHDTIEAEGQDLIDACEAASEAFESANIFENSLTAESIDSVGMEWEGLQSLARTTVSGLTQALATEKQIAALGAEQLENFKQTFKAFDKDRSNTLEFNEFSAALKAEGLTLSDSAVEKEFKSLDADRSGTLSQAEFINYMVSKSQFVANQESINQAFTVLAGEGASSYSQSKAEGDLAPATVEYLGDNCPTTDAGDFDFKAWTAAVLVESD